MVLASDQIVAYVDLVCVAQPNLVSQIVDEMGRLFSQHLEERPLVASRKFFELRHFLFLATWSGFAGGSSFHRIICTI